MKNQNIAAILFLALFGLAFAQQNSQLVWSDEFNGNGLDQSKWGYETNCDGGGNNELQCYTTQGNNLKVADGHLTITAVPQNLNGKQYTSARINTKGKASWKYGKFEIRAKQPKGAYLWPALWMMPRDSVYGGWAASGEIDIYEGRGQNPNEYQSTLHYGGSWPNNVYQGSGARNAGQDLTADYHVYTCTWTPDQISFALDGNTYYTRNLNQNFYSGKGKSPYWANRQPFDQEFFFIINLAVGGGFFGGEANALNQNTARAWPNPNLLVDYVRVYQLRDGPVVNPPAPVPTPAPTPKPATQAPSSKQNLPSSSVATPAPSQNNNNNNNAACPNGCGAGNCCKDSNLGGVCYNPATHKCIADGAQNHLCGASGGWCGKGCYDAAFYRCNNGVLAPK